MKRKKHKNDQKHPKDKTRLDDYPGKYFQGWMRPTSRELRKILKKPEIPVIDGSNFKKIGSWFEWN